MDNETIIPFYGHDRKKIGDYAVFSNFYPISFVDENNMEFMCVEQYMMYHKAKLFGDEKMADAIMQTCKPVEQKKFGRQVANFNAKVWAEKSYEIVKKGCFLKFSQNQKLVDILLDTNTCILAEAAPRDRIWGVGVGKDKARNRDLWRGQNKLGFILMEIRSQLV